MSKIKISGNASGTGVVTLTAPNTNTDRVITLPDGDISLGVGIDDNATSTAITIDSSENVGIGTTTPTQKLELYAGYIQVGSGVGSAGGVRYPTSTVNADCRNWRTRSDIAGYGDWGIEQSTTQTGETYATKFRITQDGRGLSQFTAKAWVNFDGTGTVAIRDSHNVSSINDNGVGYYDVYFSNNLANDSYSVTTGGRNSITSTHGYGVIAIRSASSTYIRLYCYDTVMGTGVGNNDMDLICLQAFGD